MHSYSACIEFLFRDESDDFIERIDLAHQAGVDQIEFWRWSDKDLSAIRRALDEKGMKVALILCEPLVALTDPANKDAFVAGVEKSVQAAQRVRAPLLVVQGGDAQPGLDDAVQDEAIISCLKAAGRVLAGTGIRLGLEPLNTLIDHKGQYVSSTRKGLDLVQAAGDPSVGIVFDLYHSGVMGERVPDVLEGCMQHVFHVHVADHPGRHEPGTGSLALREGLDWIFDHGYAGPVGLEFKPKGRTSETLPHILSALG